MRTVETNEMKADKEGEAMYWCKWCMCLFLLKKNFFEMDWEGVTEAQGLPKLDGYTQGVEREKYAASKETQIEKSKKLINWT